MLATFKSDVRKLLSVRSTWIILLVAALITIFMTFWLEGYKGMTGSAASELTDRALAEIIKNAAGLAATFTCLIAIMQVGHEYRYNTIMYTLTSSNSRLKVFLSKASTLVLFSIVSGFLLIILAIGSYFFGLSLRDAMLPDQSFNTIPELLRLTSYMAIYALFGFGLAILLRSIIGAIAVFFILPSTVEPLLGLLLKEKAVYLPISAFDHIVGAAAIVQGNLSPNKALLTGLVYIAVLVTVALFLFQKRDAN